MRCTSSAATSSAIGATAAEEDQQANEDALLQGERLLSVYRTSKDVKLWVITEADRSSTCVLLPDEY